MTNTEITAGLRQMADDMGCAMAPAGYYADEIALLGRAADLIDSMPAGWQPIETAPKDGTTVLANPCTTEQGTTMTTNTNAALREKIVALTEARDALVDDAARYRWLRSCNLAKHPAVRDGFELGDAHLDATIDAARGAQGESNEPV